MLIITLVFQFYRLTDSCFHLSYGMNFIMLNFQWLSEPLILLNLMDLMPKVYLQVSVIMLYVYLICKFLIYKTELEDDYDYVTQKAC